MRLCELCGEISLAGRASGSQSHNQGCDVRTMSDLNKQEQDAFEAVARRFRATRERGRGLRGASFRIAGKRVAVDIAILGPRAVGQPKPHLRFDKVATRVIENLQAALSETVPEGMTVLLTITAPIRLASKTTAALEDKLQTLLKSKLSGQDVEAAIHGNHIRIRLVRNQSEGAPKMVGFVHNPDTDPLLLFSMACELLDLASARADQRAARNADAHWLVLVSAKGTSCLEAYRSIVSQIQAATTFEKVLLVFGDGRVEVLAE